MGCECDPQWNGPLTTSTRLTARPWAMDRKHTRKESRHVEARVHGDLLLAHGHQHRWFRLPVPQRPFRCTTDCEHCHRPPVRRFLLRIPEGLVSQMR